MKPHFYRCETCEFLSKKDYPGGIGHCLNSKSGFLMYSQKGISLASLIEEVGCASHSKLHHDHE